MDNNEYLSHHGIKGQRWGVEHGPPYPVRRTAGGKPKTTSIVKSRLKAALQERSEASKRRKLEQEKRVEAAKERKAQKQADKHAEDFEKLKKDVVKNPKLLYKNKDKFTRKEIEELIQEIEFDRRVQDVRDTEIRRGIDRFKTFQSGVQTTANLMKNAKDIYNFVAEVHNAGADDNNKWTVLGGNKDEKKDNSGNNTQSAKSDSGSNKKASGDSGSNKKVDTSVSMSSPSVEQKAKKGRDKAQKITKKHGGTRMSTIDQAFSAMNLTGPLNFYSGNPYL